MDDASETWRAYWRASASSREASTASGSSSSRRLRSDNSPVSEGVAGAVAPTDSGTVASPSDAPIGKVTSACGMGAVASAGRSRPLIGAVSRVLGIGAVDQDGCADLESVAAGEEPRSGTVDAWA